MPQVGAILGSVGALGGGLLTGGGSDFFFFGSRGPPSSGPGPQAIAWYA
jgi:hypothetical protein